MSASCLCSQCRHDSPDQGPLLEWLAQERNRPSVQRTFPSPRFGVRRNENDRCLVPFAQQALLQVESTQPRHVQISDQARGVGNLTRFQELLRRRKDAGLVPQRCDQITDRLSDKRVIIDDRDHGGVHQIGIPTARLSHTSASGAWQQDSETTGNHALLPSFSSDPFSSAEFPDCRPF